MNKKLRLLLLLPIFLFLATFTACVNQFSSSTNLTVTPSTFGPTQSPSYLPSSTPSPSPQPTISSSLTAPSNTGTPLPTNSQPSSIGQDPTILWGAIIGIIGLIVIQWSTGILRRKTPNLGLSIGIVMAGIGLFMIASASSSYAAAFTLVGTLAAVVIAMLAVKQSTKIESLKNEQESTKEIIEWATEIGTAILSSGDQPSLARIQHEITDAFKADEFLKEKNKVMLDRLSRQLMKSAYIHEIVKPRSELDKLINTAMKQLRTKHKMLQCFIKNRDKIVLMKSSMKAAILIAKNEDKLYETILNILKQVGSDTAAKNRQNAQEY